MYVPWDQTATYGMPHSQYTWAVWFLIPEITYLEYLECQMRQIYWWNEQSLEVYFKVLSQHLITKPEDSRKDRGQHNTRQAWLYRS